MSEEIVPKEKKMNLFELMDAVFENERRRMDEIKNQLNRSIFNMYNLERNPVIKMGNIEDFQKSIEEFKKANPDAKVTARAYTFSTENPSENKVFEYNEQDKLEGEVEGLAKKKEKKSKDKKKSKKKK